MKEWMRKVIQASAVIGTLSGVLVLWNIYSAAPLQAGIPGCAIPKSYGSLKSTLPGIYVFEAADGTIRAVMIKNCEVEITNPRD